MQHSRFFSSTLFKGRTHHHWVSLQRDLIYTFLNISRAHSPMISSERIHIILGSLFWEISQIHSRTFSCSPSKDHPPLNSLKRVHIIFVMFGSLLHHLRVSPRHLRVVIFGSHIATHCSTLQHTAAHCNTLQHTATHCNTQYLAHSFLVLREHVLLQRSLCTCSCVCVCAYVCVCMCL